MSLCKELLCSYDAETLNVPRMVEFPFLVDLHNIRNDGFLELDVVAFEICLLALVIVVYFGID